MVFYEILAEELALRDMEGESLTREHYEELLERIDGYMDEFDQNGIDHLTLETDSED